ncbi:prepilin-type N-terminal cleavage/methylation domain-containing protein [Helicobacter saguini]|uniref:Prepilin-type N-terminal cleavage/methylation domain-containing protein n=1 Tax=Helicobacter saguini TaxID=1548018 RepID=A0A347VPK3_9HELI|nr:type II secretion system protein [Helicobacter saguini]MWV61318.1 prepilin-type N-terminal cleavage/methylation domain-containing protein [Helicobacter saguini]MWV68013.1 prepilin-type N-terminal cleavage/methylation domain-containing protein [Helicobacter saguini]MWV70520.1 prepilin-type N-terminal cleavage/methylation domain-containing protein [Helicobacter saguini]MWV72423.1 prepilin-type N-terminal cleavage/methylation domain-containing protein [Helicobacter saguini]TLD94812.1 type II s
MQKIKQILYRKISKIYNIIESNITKILKKTTKDSINHKYSNAFSMMELLFVLVILGILASLALPRISFSRTNALAVAIQNDIQTIISSTQEYAITNAFAVQNASPQWLISHLNLSPQRWIASGDSLKIANNGVLDSANDCLSIRFDGVNFLQINFNRAVTSNLCSAIFKNYHGNINIPLNIAF